MNAYPNRFLELIPESIGPVLDCGSGGRWLPDGVLGLDPVLWPDVTVAADGMAMPFPDNTFGLVLSQAVIEHVTRPEVYVDEVFRVLKPGGMFYAEVAFMQPVHMAPDHYFNVTPYGLSWLCRRFEIIDTGTVGYFEETIAWQCRTVEVEAPRVREPPDHLRHLAASGVTIMARKPE